MQLEPAAPRGARQFTGFRCPEPVLHALKERAECDGRSLSNLIVLILTREVKHPRHAYGK